MHVLNRGEIVGTLSDSQPDMWYLEGTFAPVDTPNARRFVAAASALDVRAVEADPTQGLRALLQDAPDQPGTTFVVMSLSDGRLFGRCVFKPEAVEWANANVPE